MKLLLDQNLSPRIVGAVAAQYPGSVHVREFDLQAAEDETIWQFAKERGYVIVSKDSDFRHRAFVRGQPPKVGWVRLGNCTTDDVLDSIVRHREHLAAFEQDEEAAFVSLS